MSAQRSHLVAAIVLDPIEEVTAVVPELRKILIDVPIADVRRAVQGKAPVYIFDTHNPETSRHGFTEVWRVVRGLGLRGEWYEYCDGNLTGSGRFGAERA
jgi:hypothetical protein